MEGERVLHKLMFAIKKIGLIAETGWRATHNRTHTRRARVVKRNPDSIELEKS